MLRKLVVAIAKEASTTTIKASSIVVKAILTTIEASLIVVEAFANMNALLSCFASFIHVTTRAILSLAIISILIDIEITIDKSLLSFRTSIDFYLMNDLIYYIKNDKIRLYIFQNTKSIVMKTTHNDCFHASYYRVYAKLSDTIYIHKLFKKLIIYIQHCSQC